MAVTLAVCGGVSSNAGSKREGGSSRLEWGRTDWTRSVYIYNDDREAGKTGPTNAIHNLKIKIPTKNGGTHIHDS